MSKTKETSGMPKRLTALATLLGTTLLLALPAAPASAADAPWWEVLSGSRPTNLTAPVDPSGVQEVIGKKGKVGAFEILVARIEVGGATVGCLGAGSVGPQSANQICTTQTGFPATETAAQLQAVLEDPYGAGEVEVTGGPAAVAPFIVTTPGQWPLPISLTPVVVGPNTLGSASAKFISEGSGRLVLTFTNLGDAPVDATSVPLTLTDTLPAGVTAYGVVAEAGLQGKAGPVECEVLSASEVTCSFEDELPSYEAIEVEVLVALTGSPSEPGTVSVSGGNAPAVSVPQPINESDAEVPFGLEGFSMKAEEVGGARTSGAGLHPFQLTTSLQFNSGRQSGDRRRDAIVEQPALPRNTRFTLPVGFVGSPFAVPRCDMASFLTEPEGLINECPDESAIGVATVTIIERATLGLVRLPVPVFNLPPEHGEPARFGFLAAGVPILIDISADPDNEYRIVAEVRNASQVAQVLSATTVLWGVPGDARHDAARGWNCVKREEFGPCQPPANRQEVPFLRMPVSCDRPLDFLLEVEPWNAPVGAIIERASSVSEALGACNQTPFDPQLHSSTLTSRAVESPSGLDFELRMENLGLSNPNDGAVSETQFKRAEVVLPEGVTANPAVAEGLAVCTPADYARERFDSVPGAGCPEASKIGSVSVSTPLLEEEVQGALYQAAPHDNPFDSLIALYLIARVPERGILVKQPIKVEPDPVTGQLISVADDVPPLPIDSFKLNFREGARSPLVTPPRCGSFETVARFVPWSAQDPEHPKADEIVTRTATSTIDRGTGGGACPSSTPFRAGFEAGSVNNDAGSFSPFIMRLTRQDGDQDLTRFSATLPAGMTAKLAGVAQCPDSSIAAARAKEGLDERANPSCPAASQIGTVLGGAGVGSVLTYAPGKLYLAGPVNGAPLSVVSIVPAVAGPFDVGTIVTRVALRINQRTGVVQADGSASDPIPHILAGLPLKVREIRVRVDRDRFTLNPTSCAEMATNATIWSGAENVFSSADDIPHSLSARFQAADCRALGFKPRLDLRLKGGTLRGDFPAFQMTYRPRQGRQANLKNFSLRFPRSEFIEQGHFRTICTRVQFAAGAGFGANCPKGSIYGNVKVFTPILDEPLTGPVFLRSSDNNLPDVVLALHGPPSVPVKLEAPARIDSIRGGLRAISTGIPDAPISRVVLNMQGGQKGLLVNSRNLCKRTNRADVQLTAHNGAVRTLNPVVRAVGCKKSRKR